MPTVRIITQQSLTDGAADRWEKQYLAKYSTPPFEKWYDEERARIGAELRAACVPGATDPARVNEIIGNGAWTRMPNCNLCKESAPVMVNLVNHLDQGEDPGWHDLCPRCVIKLTRDVFQQLMVTADKNQSVYPGLLDSLHLELERLLSLASQGKRCSGQT